jgi:hypothetical protein
MFLKRIYIFRIKTDSIKDPAFIIFMNEKQENIISKLNLHNNHFFFL